jgi:Protein of unknown function (DUF2950)
MVINDRLLKTAAGFRLVAYPADYRNSRVMTFVAKKMGAINQNSLGDSTSDVAQHMDKVSKSDRSAVVKKMPKVSV